MDTVHTDVKFFFFFLNHYGRYETDIAQVNAMNKQAAHLSNAAEAESTVALDTLKQISDLEKNLPKAPKVLSNEL